MKQANNRVNLSGQNDAPAKLPARWATRLKMKSTLSINLFRIVQAIWAIALIFILCPLILIRGDIKIITIIYFISFIIYGVATIGIFKNNRWDWILSILFLIFYWLLHGWVDVYNFVTNVSMFLSGHDLYKDSPATIFVVFINSFFTIVPGFILLILGIISWQNILTILRLPARAKPNHTINPTGR